MDEELFPPDTEPTGEAATEPSAPEQEFIEYGGRQIPVQRFNEILQVQDWIADNPERFGAFYDVAMGRARIDYGQPGPASPAPVAPAQPSPHPEQGVEGGAAPSVAALAADLAAIRAAQAEEAIEEARSEIAARYRLDESQVQGLLDFATQERIVENRARARGRFANGQFVPPAPKRVMLEALEMAYRQKYFGQAPPTPSQTRQANQRLVGSTAAGSRRSQPAPKNQADADSQMTRELYSLFGMPMPEER